MPAGNQLNICILGSPAAGKTTFLAGLAIIGEPNRGSGVTLLTRGSSHVFLRELSETLRNQAWPPSTNRTEVIDGIIKYRDTLINFHLIDFPGGDHENMASQQDIDVNEKLRTLLKEADFVLMLMDPEIDIKPFNQLDRKATNYLMRRQQAHLQSVLEASNSKLPELAVILTKRDKYPEIADNTHAVEYVKQHAGGFLNNLCGKFKSVKIFSISAVGATEIENRNGKSFPIPANNLEPTGYIEILNWMCREIRWKTWRSTFIYSGVAALSLAISLLIVRNVLYKWADDYAVIMANQSLSFVEKMQSPVPWWPIGINPEELKYNQAKTYFNDLANKIATANSKARIAQLENELTSILPYISGLSRKLHDDALVQLNTNLEGIMWLEISTAVSREINDAEIGKICQEYVSKFRLGKHIDEVKSIYDKIQGKFENESKLAIRQVVVDDKRSMLVKATKISEHIVKFREKMPNNGIDAEKAIQLARKFAVQNQYTIETNRIVGFAYNYNIYVNYWQGQIKIGKIKSIKNGNAFQWPSPTVPVNWSSGDSIQIVIHDNGYFYCPIICDLEVSGPDAILRLMDNDKYFTTNSDYNESQVQGYFRVNEIGQDEYDAFRNYILPGDYWVQGAVR